jgi:hypothetical protein
MFDLLESKCIEKCLEIIDRDTMNGLNLKYYMTICVIYS